MAKFGDNCDLMVPFKYCGFFDGIPGVQRGEQQLGAMEQWAERFPAASVFTYGAEGAGGNWQPGEWVRDISGQSGEDHKKAKKE